MLFSVCNMCLLFFVTLLLHKTTHARVDPQLHMKVPALIRSWGYPVHEHWVTTPDGYILGLHRIPAGREEHARAGSARHKPVCFLQHGLVDSSATWLLNLPRQSLGYMLADAGCDVWLGNVRGNTYSRNHTTLSTRDPRFWEFSFDEFAAVDLPAMVEYVLSETGADTLSYIGHSQGTLMANIAFSQDQALAKKINLYGALAPVARITHVQGLIKYLNYVEPPIQRLVQGLGIQEFAPSNFLTRELAALVCPLERALLCKKVMFLTCGWDERNLNLTRVPVYLAHTPAGTSVRNMVHWAQILRNKRLRRFDHGTRALNMKHYNSPQPPEYDLTGLTVPTALFAGGNDFLADPRDVAWLEGQLGPGVLLMNQFYDEYNHLDFVWGVGDVTARVNGILVGLIPGL